ncbi:MAG: hypothetical protein HWE27_13760 [Gammaproteobacteria bacterium]|nr:hypothetical protein [Gammaproteobacteria bacterium]
MKYNRLLAVFICLGTFVAHADRFPIEGESEFYIHWQKQGELYSLTAVKPQAESWSYSEGNQSTQAFIFNKSVRAIKGGKVVACWRGAPDNKVIGSYNDALGLSTSEVDTLMPEYGNHLWIEHSDGSRTLYAYLQEESIPKTLCPNQDALFKTPIASPSSPEVVSLTAVPSSKQPTVSEGLYLGRVGNSGKSDKTQLGLRFEKNGQLQPVVFERGLFSMKAMKQEFLKWQPIENRAIPLDSAFFWPVRSIVSDLPKIKLSLEEHERQLPWLRESGFSPAYSDVYQVGNKAFINVSWRPSKTPWLMYGLLTAMQHKQTMEQAFIEGFSLKILDTTLVNGELRFHTVYIQDLSQVLTQHSMTLADFNKLKYQARKQGFGAAAISVQYKNDDPIITALFRPDMKGEQEYFHAINADKFEEYQERVAKKNLHPIYVNGVISHLGQLVSVIFAQRLDTQMDGYEMELSDIKNYQKAAGENGFVTGMISGYDHSEDDHEFVGFWEKLTQ